MALFTLLSPPSLPSLPSPPPPSPLLPMVHHNLKNLLFPLDLQLARMIYGPSKRWPWLKQLCEMISLTCDGLVWILGPILWGYVFQSSKDVAAYVSFLYMAVLVDIAVGQSLKGLVRRRRPPHFIDDSPTGFVSVDIFSFPSGHVSRAVIIVVIAQHIPAWIPYVPILTAWAAIIALTRLALGRHYPSDVCVAAILGWAVGVLGISSGLFTYLTTSKFCRAIMYAG